jgi:hypothetical protein
MTIPQMGLWESVIIVVAFSIFVVVADEYIHARRKRQHEREDAARRGH